MHLQQAAFSLPVAEPQRTHRFYAKVFGAQTCALDVDTVSLQLPGVTVFFIERESFNKMLKPAQIEADFATGKYTAMLSATVLTRDEAYASLKSAAEAGGTPCGQAVSYSWGIAAYFKDPDQHLWEILWRDPRYRE